MIVCLNRKHLVAPAVESLADLRSTLISRLADEISRTELADHLTTEDPILNDWAQPNIPLTGLPLTTLLAEAGHLTTAATK